MMDWKRLMRTLLPVAVVLMLVFMWQMTGESPQADLAASGSAAMQQSEGLETGLSKQETEQPKSEAQKKSQQQKSTPENTAKANSMEARAREIAKDYILTDKEYEEHIVARHGADSTYGGKSKFLPDYDLRSGIDEALTSENTKIRENTNGRDGYLFELTYAEPIGTDDRGHEVNTIRVVMGADGFVVTAFPVR